MSKNNQKTNNDKPSSHDLLWWFLLIPLLLIVLSLGAFLIIKHEGLYPYLLGIGAFSIAYAIHFLAVSCTLCSLYIKEDRENITYLKFRDLEYRIVTSGMLVLSGGLGIILAGGLYSINFEFTLCVYLVAAILLFVSVLKYVLFERRWPREAMNIFKEKKTPAEQGH